MTYLNGYLTLRLRTVLLTSENTTTAATTADITVNQPEFFTLELLDING